MMDNSNGYAMERKTTLRERFWRKMGFHFHLGDEPDGTDAAGMVGWQKTHVNMDFSLGDRLRLLLTGRLRITVTQHTDAPSPSIIKNRTDWEIGAPGERP